MNVSFEKSQNPVLAATGKQTKVMLYVLYPRILPCTWLKDPILAHFYSVDPKLDVCRVKGVLRE